MAKLGGNAAKVYIGLMRARLSLIARVLLVVAMLAASQLAAAQGFSADYGLVGGAVSQAEPAGGYRAGPLEIGAVRLGPSLQADRQFSGAGLSLAAGQNWFAQVAVGRSLQQNPVLPGVAASDAIRVGGGYRWSDGQTLSLQVSRGQALGLQLSYDWPHYFVRLSYDSRLNLNPPDLRFSAGMRF